MIRIRSLICFSKETIISLRKKLIHLNKKIVKEITGIFHKERKIDNSEVTEFLYTIFKARKAYLNKFHGESASAGLTQITTLKSYMRIKGKNFY